MSDSPALAEGVAHPAAPKIDAELYAVIQQTHKALLWGKLNAVADHAWSMLTKAPDMPTVVVIGEVKRGKSSLVNALLGRPDASPVGVDIMTSAFVRFAPATGSAAAGDTALLYAGGRRRVIDLADLPDWVTVSGRHVTDPKIDELPIGAEVAMAGEFLPRVALVDTPGVGGLNPSHLRLVKAATARASILVMTCEATAPITAPELTFLKSISAEVDSVVIAVTKIDKDLLHWRSIIDENRRLLREHAPRFADVAMVGVSSLLALSALKISPGQQRESALRACGLAELVERLDAMCASGDQLHVANGLRTARSGLEVIAKRLAMQRSVLVKGPTAAADLSDEKERLAALQKQWESGWRDYPAGDLGALQRTTLATVDHKLDELKTQWRQRLDKTKLGVLQRSPQVFVADMTADLQAVVAEVSDEYSAGVANLVEQLALTAEVSVEGLNTPIRAGAPGKRFAGVMSPQLLSYASMGSYSIPRLLGMVGSAVGIGAAGVATGGLGLAIAGAWFAVNAGYQAIKMGRQNLQQWLINTANAVSKDLTREIQDRNKTIRPVIVNEYRQQLSDSMAELKKLIQTAQDAAKASHAERADGIAELEAKWKALKEIVAAVDAQLAELSRVTAQDSPR